MDVVMVTPIEKRGYASPEVLVSTDWVAEHLDDDQVRIARKSLLFMPYYLCLSTQFFKCILCVIFTVCTRKLQYCYFHFISSMS